MERVSRCFRGHDVRVECSARPRWMQRWFRSAGASTCAARVVFFETRSRINARRRKKGCGVRVVAHAPPISASGGDTAAVDTVLPLPSLPPDESSNLSPRFEGEDERTAAQRVGLLGKKWIG